MAAAPPVLSTTTRSHGPHQAPQGAGDRSWLSRSLPYSSALPLRSRQLQGAGKPGQALRQVPSRVPEGVLTRAQKEVQAEEKARTKGAD